MGKNNVLREKDVGAIGIGAMIVFIAMVLVAGIAASVLIQTSNRLETQAMATGSDTTAEVASGLDIVDVEGHANTSADICYLGVMIRPRAGSDDIDLSHAFIEISDTSKKLVLNYTSQLFVPQASLDGDIFLNTNFDKLAANSFSVMVVEDPDSSCSSSTPIINRGDKVILSIDAADTNGFAQISERTDVWGMVVPEHGAPGIISFRTPATYTTNVMDLQ